MSGPVTSVARVEDVQIFLKDPVYARARAHTHTNTHEYIAQFFLEWNMSHTQTVGKIERNILCLITFFFFKEIRAVYEIMLKNILERCRPQMTIWRIRIACSVTKATDTHSEYVMLIARTRLDVALYVHCLS